MSSPATAVERPSGRWYPDPEDPDRFYPSVTTVISASQGKPWLAAWTAKLAAEYAVAHHALIGEVLAGADGPEAAVGLIKDAANRARDLASNRGTLIHDLAEALARDLPLPELPDDDLGAAGLADALVSFFVDHDPQILHAETTVYSRKYRYAGTLDGIFRLPRIPGSPVAAVDVKTGTRPDPSDVAMQLAGYRRADRLLLRNGMLGDLPEIDATFMLHLRPDGSYQLLPVDSGEAHFQALLVALRLFWHRDSTGRRAFGRPVHIAGQPIPVGDVEGVSRWRKPLADAGLTTLQQVAALVAERGVQALAVWPGIGPAALDAVRAALTAYGLNGQEAA